MADEVFDGNALLPFELSYLVAALRRIAWFLLTFETCCKPYMVIELLLVWDIYISLC